MKVKLTKLLVLALAVAMLLCGCAEGVQISTTQSSDGIVAVFTTDKDNYSGTDTAKADLKIVNNTGKKVAVSTDIKAPDGLELNLDTVAGSFQVEPGQSISLSEITVKMSPLRIILTIVLSLLAVCAAAIAVFIIVRKKKTKQVTSMLLCVILVAGIVMSAPPAIAVERTVDYAGSMTIDHPVTVDGKEVVIEVTVNYEIGVQEKTDDDTTSSEEEEWVDPDCDKPNAKVTAFFYNDYDGDKAMVDKGATLRFNEQKMDLASDGENGYLRCEIASEEVNGFYQADFKNNKIVDNLVVHFEISTENQVPNGMTMVYRYSETSSTTLFSFDQDGNMVLKGNAYSQAKVEPGKWLAIDLVFDLTPAVNDRCTVYANGEKLIEMDVAKHEENYKISYMRFNLAQKGNLGKTALIDNFMIYESAEILDITEVNSPAYPYYPKAKEGEDVAMELPDLAELPDKLIAIATGTNKAYVNGEIITMSTAAQDGSSGDVFTDAFVPGDFLAQYMGVSGISTDRLHSLLRYASGKNVLVDSRGFILLTEDETLDPEEDVKLLTLLYGYLTTGQLTYNYAANPAWTQSVIDEAVASDEFYWCEAGRRSVPALQAAANLYYLVLVAHMTPDAAASDGTLVADEAVKRIKNMISGGKEPPAEIGTCWEHATAGSAILLAKNTPIIWDQMTEDDIKRMDLLMECLAIAANWGFNADNNYLTGFDFYGNFSKGYNPNYRNSYLTNYMNGAMYFGPEKLDEMFVNFNYDSIIARLKEVGFVNILYYWTTTDMLGVSIGHYLQYGGEIVLSIGDRTGESGGSGVGVAVPFKYQNLEKTQYVYDSSQLKEIFISSIEFTYSWEVMSSNQAPGSVFYAGTLTGAKSPWEGQMGMMREFSEGEDRSKVTYTYLSAINIAPLYANMKLLGYWDYDSSTPEMKQKMLEMDNRIYVGTEDLFFKMHEGYLGCSQKKQVEEYEWQFNQQYGASYTKDIFMNFHFMKNDETNMLTQDVIPLLEEAAEPKDGITEPSENAIVAVGRKYNSDYATDLYALLDGGKGYTSGKVSFDLTIDDAVLSNDFNGIINIDKKYPTKDMAHSPMRIKLYNGQISITNGDEYIPIGLSFGANYKFHVEIEFDVATRKYSGTITQTWPETEKTKTRTFEDYVFLRSAQNCDYIDAIYAVDGNIYSQYWLENVEISGASMTPPPIKTTVETKVNIDWGDIPASVRPKELEVYLVMNGWQSERTVKLTAANGWAAEFDNLARVIDDDMIDWSVAVETAVDKYYPVVVKNGARNYTIKWALAKYYYNNDFENWNKGQYVSGKTPIYDADGKILLDNWSSTKGEITQGVEENGNHYLKFTSEKSTQAALTINEDITKGVYAIRMKLKPGSTDLESTGRLHFSYRYDQDGKSVKDDFIKLSYGSLVVGGHSLGTLSADTWTEVYVVLDFNTRTGEVFYGNSAERKTFYLQIPNNAQFAFWTKEGSNIFVDDLQIYTMADLHVEKPVEEGNREEEIIVPSTPPAKLDTNYTWYYSADFEYWNKGAYTAGNTPITDAYGNVMTDQWNSSKGPMVRGEEANGNHYLELTSEKSIQGAILVDEAFDDGTYIVKWRMKLKDANSKVSSGVFSYRTGNNKKHNFATISETKTTICGVKLDALSTDKWMEVMVVLDFTTMTGTVCDWQGNKLGSTEILPITGSMFNIYSSEGMQGLCIDDLQIFSGKVTINETETPPAGGEGDEPVTPPVTGSDWFYNNNFDNGTAKPNGTTVQFVDSLGNALVNGSGLYQMVTLADGNVVLELISNDKNSTSSIKVSGEPKVISVKFKTRLATDTTTIASGAVEFRHRDTDGTKPRFLSIGDNKITVGGTSVQLSTAWTDVEMILDVENFKIYYKLGAAEQYSVADLTSKDFGTLAELNLYIGSGRNLSGLYIDDLQVGLGEIPQQNPPAEEEPVTPPAGGDTAEKVDMTVTVTWDNKQNPEPPKALTVTLYKNGVRYTAAEVTEAQGWTYTFADLPKYDDQNNKITYTVAVASADVPAGYVGNANGATIDMIYIDAKLKIEVAEEEQDIAD